MSLYPIISSSPPLPTPYSCSFPSPPLPTPSSIPHPPLTLLLSPLLPLSLPLSNHVLATLSGDVNKVLGSLRNVRPKGKVKFISGIRIAQVCAQSGDTVQADCRVGVGKRPDWLDSSRIRSSETLAKTLENWLVDCPSVFLCLCQLLYSLMKATVGC